MRIKHKRWGVLSVHEQKHRFVLLVGCHIDTLPYESIGKELCWEVVNSPNQCDGEKGED